MTLIALMALQEITIFLCHYPQITEDDEGDEGDTRYLSDHITIMLTPAYRQKVRVIRQHKRRYVCGQRGPALL